jgi:hypothetical protein
MSWRTLKEIEDRINEIMKNLANAELMKRNLKCHSLKIKGLRKRRQKKVKRPKIQLPLYKTS